MNKNLHHLELSVKNAIQNRSVLRRYFPSTFARYHHPNRYRQQNQVSTVLLAMMALFANTIPLQWNSRRA